jgi:hypothetical protein
MDLEEEDQDLLKKKKVTKAVCTKPTSARKFSFSSNVQQEIMLC